MLFKNRSFQFIVGCFTLYTAWQLHSAGFFAAVAAVFSSTDQYQGLGGILSDLAAIAVPVLFDAVVMVGIVSIAVTKLMWGLVKPWAVRLAILIDKQLEKLGVDLYELEVSSAPEPRTLDLGELETVLGRILDRLSSLEASGDNKENK